MQCWWKVYWNSCLEQPCIAAGQQQGVYCSSLTSAAIFWETITETFTSIKIIKHSLSTIPKHVISVCKWGGYITQKFSSDNQPTVTSSYLNFLLETITSSIAVRSPNFFSWIVYCLYTSWHLSFGRWSKAYL